MKHGELAGALLSLSNPHVISPHILQSRPDQYRILCPPWDEIVIYHIKCVQACSNHNFIEAFKEQLQVIQSFSKILQSQKDENWALHIMYAITLDLRKLAYNANDQSAKQSSLAKSGDCLEKAADSLMGIFRVCVSDNRSALETTKRLGMLNIVNHLFKIYFKINKLHLCKPLIKAVDSSSSIKEGFKIAQLVTYNYHVGKKAIFDSEFKTAEECLTFAFKRCHKDSIKNKQHILFYLIPVKMLFGHMPSMELLNKYSLHVFEEVVLAVKQGNISRFNNALQNQQQFFINYGIYFILEKLKNNTYRNLFKKIHLLLKTHQLPLEAFLGILTKMGEEDMDIDEVHCIVANLIYEGKIRGYVAYQQNKLVVSKQTAFPALT